MELLPEERPAYDIERWQSKPEYAAKKLAEMQGAGEDESLYYELLGTLVSNYREGEKVLDIGCAGGHVYGYLRKFSPAARYTGLDCTPAYLRVARATFGDLFVRGDCRQMPFRDGAFEHILCLFVLVHLDEEGLVKTLKELTRVASRMVFLAGYFSQWRVPGRQGDFIYDVVPLDVIARNARGWRMVLPKRGVPDGHRKLTLVLEPFGEVELDVWSYVWLLKEG